jgi:hypothetical protein
VPQVNGSALSQSVAHELNSIAASLFGFVELAAEQAIADAPLLKCLGEIPIASGSVDFIWEARPLGERTRAV